MLLIVTQRDDYHADWVILELRARGLDFVRFNTEDYPTAAGLEWGSGGETHLTIRGRRHNLASFDAVWYRRPVPPVMPADWPAEQAAWAAGEAREALMGAWRTLDAVWVNHPDRNRVAESKPLQLRVAQQLGLEVPDSLVANSAEAARAFLEKQATDVVCKPLYDGKVPTADEHQLFFSVSWGYPGLPARPLSRSLSAAPPMNRGFSVSSWVRTEIGSHPRRGASVLTAARSAPSRCATA